MLELHFVDFPRLQADIESLAEIGRDKNTQGICRPAFTEAYFEAAEFFKKRIEDAGLIFRQDEALNLYGRLESGNDTSSVICGSHLDSVPGGGHLDGALGVLAGLESLRRLKELGVSTLHPIEVVAFTDEEGRFGGMFGSQAVSGQLTPGSINNARDLSGVSLVDVLSDLGHNPHHALRATRSPSSVRAFVELHIEQGPVLDANGRHLGVVEGICGLFKWTVSLIGQADHAGTTPMSMRRDALLGFSEFAGAINRVIEEDGSERSVATIGHIEVKPGAANVVPVRVDFTLEARDINPDVLAELANGFRRALSAIARRRKLMFEFEVLSEIDPVNCDKEIQRTISRVAKDLGQDPWQLPSGAAHDAQMMADFTSVGMIFVPSKDGRSHSPAEWTPWESIEIGANCLLNTLCRLANS